MNRITRSLLVAAGLLFLGFASVALVPTVASAGPVGDPGEVCGPEDECEETEAEVEVCQAGDACNTFIDTYIEPFVTLLTISIGLIAAISVIVAGIQYASAADDPGKVSKAKDRVWQTVIGLVAYIFLFAFLNYLVPGGIL